MGEFMFWVGIIAFALFVLNDLNDLLDFGKAFKILFWIGSALLLISVIYQCITGSVHTSAAGFVLAAVFALVFLVLMLYSLFGSFSVEEGYLNPGAKRLVYTKKMYALCRHPGVLWFAFLMICLYFMGLNIFAAVTYALLNIALAAFEDIVVFPGMLSGYDEYRRRTRFLIPDIRGIKACINDFKGKM